MVTASIVDGLGRGYQVKKNAEVDGKRKMIVSLYINSKGEMMTFDAIGIDAKGTSDYAKSRKQSVLDFASFLVEHGAGHNASLNHSTEPNKREKQNCANSAIMGGGRWIDDALNGIGEFRNINEIKTNNHKYFNNSTYVKLMKEKFGDNLSKINYK